tara:strand:+ start:1989 stop:2600 length:612 start_codon:yes stop_codon:yes gene_type:complete
MKSLSEIETTSKRATRAAGFSWGISEEVGKCIRLLELFGLPGIKNLNSYFEEKNLNDFEKLNFINKENQPHKNTFCPINLGVSFLDQIKTIETFKNCIFQNMSYPILFLPFLSRASEIIGKKILFNFDKNQFLLNFNVNILSNSIEENYPHLAKKIEINFIDNVDNFSELEWKSLYKLSEETFVEESDSLKQGAAGAGLTDND